MLDPYDVSLIISVYKNTAVLRKVLEGLALQTVREFEVVIAEDGDDPAMKQFIDGSHFPGFSILHTTQEDVGWRKNMALNNAVKASSNETLIFIDGDCIPHHKFVEAHLSLVKPGIVVSGRRVVLGPKITDNIIEDKIPLARLYRRYWRLFPRFLLDGGSHFEEGIYIKPQSKLASFIGKKIPDILGSNFACMKQDLIDINGFDEDYVWPRGGEDNDINWRLRKNGVELVSARNLAIQYHLFHGRSHYTKENKSKILLQKKMQEGVIFCKNGIVKKERQEVKSEK